MNTETDAMRKRLARGENPPPGARIVQKYGGTSVGSVERIKEVADRIARMIADGHRKIAVVVSAMSGETNRLVELAHAVNPEIPGKALDMAISAGEQVSVALLGAALERVGVPTDLYLGYRLGILTTDSHTQARILSIQTERILSGWEEGRIAVVAGFQGVSSEGDITTLGRGGSDTSAVALAVALNADLCEINTDVDGVFSADPRYVPGAKLISLLDYETALEMASLGSKVLHSRCVEIAARHDMPIKVRNSFNPDERIGTMVMKLYNEDLIESPAVSGVALQKSVARAVVGGIKLNALALQEIFSAIAAREINVDIIVYDADSGLEPNSVSFTIDEKDLGVASQALHDLAKARGWDSFTLNLYKDLVKVSMVGVGMRSYCGVASQAFAILAQNHIDIIMVSTSEIKISCVISAANGEQAVRLLHESFVQ